MVVVTVRDTESGVPIPAAFVEIEVRTPGRGFPTPRTGSGEPDTRPGLLRIREALASGMMAAIVHRASNRSDSEGRAVFRAVPGGSVTMLATLTEADVDFWGIARVTLGVSDSTMQVRVDVSRLAGRIAGRVIDDRGRPVADAEVRLARRLPPLPGFVIYQRHLSRSRYHTAQADADGQFVFDRLAPSKDYVVATRSSGYGTAISERLTVVPSGITRTILRLQRSHTVHGRIVYPSDRPPPEATEVFAITILDRRWRSGDALSGFSYMLGDPVSPNADGTFALEVANAVRWVVVEAHASGYVPVRLVVDVARGSGSIRHDVPDLVFARLGRIVSGTVVAAGAGPVRARIEFIDEADQVHHGVVESDLDGAFRFDGLAGKPYMLVVSPLDPESGFGIVTLDRVTPDAIGLRIVLPPE